MPDSGTPFSDIVEWAMSTVNQVLLNEYKREPNLAVARKLHDYEFPPQFFDGFKDDENHFLPRILFYLVWRAALTSVYGLLFEQQDFERAVEREIQIFQYDLRDLLDLREMRPEPEVGRREGFCVQAGLYSRECVIPRETFVPRLPKGELHVVGTKDAAELLEGSPKRFDLIITDPPYGFNTDPKSAGEFARFYTEAVHLMVKSTKDSGQIVLCLPEQAQTGQRVPYFATKSVVVPEVMLSANEDGKEVIKEAYIKPYPPEIFGPPYR
jgi:RMKL-like, methyltransferase domain